MMDSIATLRSEYETAGLSEHELDANPLTQFERWLHQAIEAHLPEPLAMTCATATRDGQPSARMVLLRGHDERGFVFYTDTDSVKGRDLAQNPRAALVFYWAELHRQVRVTGMVTQLSAAESDTYYASRPVGSRLGAWASRQSRVIANRAVLEEQYRHWAAEYPTSAIPRPPYWGGYRVLPDMFEFWQGRPSRLHDRVRYTRLPEHLWRIERLSP